MTDLDLSQSIIPKSDQINYEDMANGASATYTIRSVTSGNAEQPFNFMLVETDKAYRPSKTMRKVIVAAWGPKTGAYVGRRLTIYGEPSILFGGKKVGGLRISAMSDISGTLEVMAQTTRGKREIFLIQPLASSEVAAPAQSESAPESEPTLKVAIAAQLAALSADEHADLASVCEQLGVKQSRDGLIEAWGDGCRDLKSMIASVKERVS